MLEKVFGFIGKAVAIFIIGFAVIFIGYKIGINTAPSEEYYEELFLGQIIDSDPDAEIIERLVGIERFANYQEDLTSEEFMIFAQKMASEKYASTGEYTLEDYCNTVNLWISYKD